VPKKVHLSHKNISIFEFYIPREYLGKKLKIYLNKSRPFSIISRVFVSVLKKKSQTVKKSLQIKYEKRRFISGIARINHTFFSFVIAFKNWYINSPSNPQKRNSRQ
jgi:hypothetical protein